MSSTAVAIGELYRDQGVVLRTYKLRESDRIVVLLTHRFGKVRAVAKGVRRTNSKFGSRLEPMSHVEVLLRKGRDLDLVSQAESIDALAPMLSSLDRAAQGMAVVEAADQLSLEGEPDERLFTMLIGVLRTIAESPSPLNVAAFFWKVLAASGLSPVLDECVRCGEPEEGETELVAFDLNEGGALCRRCRSGASVSPIALEIMRDILGGRRLHDMELEESPATSEVTALATRALEHHIERRLRTVGVFERH